MQALFFHIELIIKDSTKNNKNNQKGKTVYFLKKYTSSLKKLLLFKGAHNELSNFTRDRPE